MSKQYKYSAKDAGQLNKHGIDLTIYNEGVPTAHLVHVSVKEGHFQEFYDVESTYMYYIISGNGVFVLDDEEIEVEPTDLLVIPPKVRIHYFGKLEMVLVNTPAFNPENERHVRLVDKSESPFNK